MTFSIDCKAFRDIMLDFRDTLGPSMTTGVYVTLETTEEGLLVTSTSATRNVALSALYDYEIEGRPNVALYAKQLRRVAAVAREARDGALAEFSPDSTGDILIATVDGSRTIVPIAANGLVPTWREPEFKAPYYLRRADLLRAMRQTVFAIAHVKDSPKELIGNPRAYKRRGLCLEIKADVMCCAGMDEARMAWADVEIVHGSRTREDYTAVVHWEAAKQLLRILKRRTEEYVALSFEPGRLQFCAFCGDATVRGLLLSEAFPDFRARLKPDWGRSFIAVRQQMLDLAARYVDDAGREAQVWFAFKQPHMFSRAHKVAPADEQLPIDVAGEEIPSFGLRARLLVDALQALTSHTVEVAIASPTEPCFIRGPEDEGVMQVIVPLE